MTKFSKTDLEILTLTLAIVFLMIPLLLFLLLPNKHCMGKIRVFHEKRNYKRGRR